MSVRRGRRRFDADAALAAAYRAAAGEPRPATAPRELARFLDTLPAQASAWRHLAARAAREGMAGWLHRALTLPAAREGVREASAPPEVLDRLAREATLAAAGNLERHAALGEIARALRGAGIEATVLKGMALLLEGIPGDWRLRPTSDIDLLLPRARFRDGARALEGIGFRALPHVDRTLARGRVVCDLHGLADADLTGVIHVPDAANPVALPAAWFAEGSRRCATMPLRVPRLDRLFTHLAIHLAYEHGFSRWIWAVDLLEILRRRPGAIDREALARQARERGFAPLLGLVRDVLRARFGECPGIEALLGTFEAPRGLASGIARALYIRGRRPRAARYAFAMAWKGTPRYRAAMVARAVLPRGRPRGGARPRGVGPPRGAHGREVRPRGVHA